MNKSWPLSFLGFACGIGLAYYKAWHELIFVVTALLLISFIYRNNRSKIVLLLLVICGGLGYYEVYSVDFPAELPIVKTSYYTGRVQDFPYFDGQKTTFTFQPETPSPYQKKIRVVCLFQATINRGDIVQLKGNLKAPARPGNPGEFNFAEYLANQGVYYGLTVKKANELSLVASEGGLLRWVDSFRQRGEQIIRYTLLPQESSVLLGMILGGRQGMDDQQYDDFQKTGIVHLFSVGGWHVGFLLLLVHGLTTLARLPKKTRFFSGVAILLIYGTMIGWPPPVIRAVLMGILGLLAYYHGRENSLLNALAISGLLILILNPATLFNLSFQLTFLATWGLVYVFPLLKERFPYKGWAWDLILIPISAELAIIPMIAYHFNLLTPISLVSNILVTYLSAGAVILGFIAFFLASIVPSLAALFFYPTGIFIEIILFITNWVKLVPGAYLWVATPAIGMVVLYFAALFIGILALKSHLNRRYIIIASALILAFIVGLLIPAGYYNRGFLEIVFIDVGQGDSILLKSPQGKFVLVDGGGSQFYDVGMKTLLPYLHYRGIRQLDMIINTHPDMDHLKGLESVAGEIKSGYLGLPASIINCKEYQTLKTITSNNNIPVVPLRAGQLINLEEGLEIKVLNPEKESYTGNEYNPESVVLELRYLDFSAVLTGDIPAEFMTSVLREAETPVTLVNVPHHGSKGSLLPAFYDRLQPRYAVISVGENNTFGHPHPAVMEMLAQQGIKVFRTDQDGAVVIRSDGRELMVSGTIRGD